MHADLSLSLRHLKRDFPLSRPVRVRTYDSVRDEEGTRLFGCASLRNGVFLIMIERHADMSVQIDTLWHEWTHCLIWPRCRRRHSKHFWRVYGQIYSHYQD